MFHTIDYSLRVFYNKRTKLALLLILASNETDDQWWSGSFPAIDLSAWILDVVLLLLTNTLSLSLLGNIHFYISHFICYSTLHVRKIHARFLLSYKVWRIFHRKCARNQNISMYLGVCLFNHFNQSPKLFIPFAVDAYVFSHYIISILSGYCLLYMQRSTLGHNRALPTTDSAKQQKIIRTPMHYYQNNLLNINHITFVCGDIL